MPDRITYVLPFKAGGGEDLDELTAYLRSLSLLVDVIVVDGSAPPEFERHRELWGEHVTHVPPREGLAFANGKVDGVVTGVELARSEKVVVADEDVRYDVASLQKMSQLLEDYDLVRPQNYFDPLPWHALWDTGRILLNRAFVADYPGTLGVRRSAFVAAGGYDGDAMFENLEMIRTIEEAGGSSVSPLDLYVKRLPPESAEHFLAQRPRQAYDDLAQPWRLVTFAAVLPAAAAAARRRPVLLSAGIAGVVALAERGRRRAGGASVFPPEASLMAPVWVLERAVCVWIAMAHRLLGGIPYRDLRLKVAANSRRTIRRRLASGRSLL